MLDKAIVEYEKALKLNANLSEAQHNLNLVKRMKEFQKSQK
jgi:hypothetical protein